MINSFKCPYCGGTHARMTQILNSKPWDKGIMVMTETKCATCGLYFITTVKYENLETSFYKMGDCIDF